MTDKDTGLSLRFIRSFDMNADLALQRACEHRHCVTVGPLAMCRECMVTFPLSIHPLARLQSSEPDVDTEDCESPDRLS